MSEEDIMVSVQKYRSGLSAMTIGRQLGFDAQTILMGLRSVGIKIHPRQGWRSND